MNKLKLNLKRFPKSSIAYVMFWRRKLRHREWGQLHLTHQKSNSENKYERHSFLDG